MQFLNSIFPVGVTQAQLTEQLATQTQQLATNAGLTYRSAAVDLVGGTNALIGTTAAGYGRFRVTLLAVRCVTVDTFATPAVISIGTNGTDYDNIIASWTLTDLDTVNQVLQQLLADGLTVAAGTGIYVKVATPAGATAMTAVVEIQGVYQGA